MLIWIASYPRSGNTFFRHALTQLYGVSTYEKYAWGPNHTPLSLEGFQQLRLPFALSFAEMKNRNSHFFVKTHDMPDDDSPAVYLVRDGRDALISHAHFHLEWDLNISDPTPEQLGDVLQSLIEKDGSFGGWSGNVQAWTGRSAPTVVVRFEDLVFSPLENVRRAMSKIGFAMSEVRTTGFLTFDELHIKYPRFFRRGKIGAWRDELPSDLHTLFWQRHGETMRALGYRRGPDDHLPGEAPAGQSRTSQTRN